MRNEGLSKSAVCAALLVLAAAALLNSELRAEEPEPDEDDADSAAVSESPEDRARIYRTREERREAGQQHPLTPWLRVSDLVEVEADHDWQGRIDPEPDEQDRAVSTTLELGLEVTPLSWATAEVLFELEHEFQGDDPKGTLDEASLALTARDFELEMGRIYVPFGEYFSHFVSGPMIEFGETRGDGLDASWGPSDRLDASVFVYAGDAETIGGDDALDWGLSVQGFPLETLNLGVSYLSDLADAKDGLLEDLGNEYAERVDAVSAFAVLGIDRFEATLEFVNALGAFAELDAERNQPRAWNVELAFFPKWRFDGALRLEGSEELEGEPELQGGLALSWRIARTASLTVEYLQGSFDQGENPEGLETARRIGALVSMVF